MPQIVAFETPIYHLDNISSPVLTCVGLVSTALGAPLCTRSSQSAPRNTRRYILARTPCRAVAHWRRRGPESAPFAFREPPRKEPSMPPQSCLTPASSKEASSSPRFVGVRPCGPVHRRLPSREMKWDTVSPNSRYRPASLRPCIRFSSVPARHRVPSNCRRISLKMKETGAPRSTHFFKTPRLLASELSVTPCKVFSDANR